ncbi:hypothetical protein COO60DRAFT_1460997 [Scenedesmus sp. NREL 46B-D3]|nr:hypothetical protein COO60DRAFT_1460997 [Scenedesmus sp. NREL 46B-D3]
MAKCPELTFNINVSRLSLDMQQHCTELRPVSGKMQNVCERCTAGYIATEDGLNCGLPTALAMAACASAYAASPAQRRTLPLGMRTTWYNWHHRTTMPAGYASTGFKCALLWYAVVMAGVQLSQDDLDAAQTLAASGDGLGDMAVNLCPYGTYFPGGVLTGNSTCVPCPFNTTTQAVGATSESDCQIPPGYYVKTSDSGATGVMEACPNNVTGQGYYRSGWTIHSDSKAQGPDGTTACTPCGAGILSALTDVDESLGGNDTTKLVAGSSYSCYIEGGWGMAPTGVILPDNTLQFSAVQCANNTYGVANTTYGLQSTPCKQIAITDCYVSTGYGIFVGNDTNAWAPATSGMSPTEKAELPVLPCPVGYYGTGGQLDSKCDTCGPGTSTAGEGSISSSACNKCAAGWGRSIIMTGSRPRPSNCSICLAGTYQPGYLGNDGTGFGAGSTCITCATTRSVYISSQGNETEYVSEGTTYRNGAIRREECVPKTAQLGIDIGTKMFENATLLTADSAGPGNEDPESCMDTNCNSGQCCFVQFDYAYTKEQGLPGTKACLFVNMPANTNSTAHEKSTSNLLYYKMLPSDAIAAASLPKPAGTVEAKAMSSGLYARCDLPVSWAASGVYDTDQIGNRIGSAFAAGSAADLAECKRMCDMSSICWGFTVQNRLCQLRGGFDELDARSFFRNPDNPTGFNW